MRADVCALPRFAVLYSEVTIGDTVSKADEHRFFFFFVVWFLKRCIEEFQAPSPQLYYTKKRGDGHKPETVCEQNNNKKENKCAVVLWGRCVNI